MAGPSGSAGGGARASGHGGPAPRLDSAKLSRYQGRVARLDRDANGRVVAVLTDGSVVDVTEDAPPAGPPAAEAPAVETPAAETPATGPPAAGTPAAGAPAAGALAAETPAAAVPPAGTHDPGSRPPTDPRPRKRVPLPLRRLATSPAVADVSQVDATTWRVSGDLTADEVRAGTGLPASEDLLLQLNSTNDTYSSLLWALENNGGSVGGFPATEDADVDGAEANARATGSGVIVAIVDSGIQPDHPDLPALWRNTAETCGNGVDDDRDGYVDDCTGWDFVHNDNTPYDAADSNDHGTHVAGTIAAVANNGRGVAGLAPGATLMSLKVTANGSIYLSHAAQAIRFAADHGAKVINASFGTSPGAPREAAWLLEDAIGYARTKGVLVVAAAGNSATNTDAAAVWPADLPLANVMSVGASTAADQVASFSNYGATSVDLFAPGHYIASTVDKSGYAAMQGTSMAAPHVAAAAALLLSQNPALTPDAIRQRLIDTADPVAAFTGRSVAGGRLNADHALAPDPVPDVSVEAGGFHDFTADQQHTATLKVTAAPDLVPAGSRVTWRGTLLTGVNGTTYGVVEHPVAVDGTERTTDASAQLLLGPADGVDAADPALTGSGLTATLSTSLPAGAYALVVDLVAATDPQHAYGDPVALFFTVPTPGQPPASGDQQPAPGGGGQAPGGPAPGDQAPGSPAPGGPAPGGPVPGGQVPGGTTPAPPGSNPWTGPWTGPGGGDQPGSPPGGGTVPAPPGPGNQPGDTPGGVPGGGDSPGSPGGGAPGPGNQPGSPGGAPGGNPPVSVPGDSGRSTPADPPPAPGNPPAPSNPDGPAGPPPPPPVSHDGITITSVSPNHGSATGGTAVMITGSHLPTYPVVYLGGQPAYVASSGSVSITILTPAGTPGALVGVTVSDRAGNDVTMSGAFRYDGPSAPGGSGPGDSGPGGSGPGGSGPGGSGPGDTPGNVPGGNVPGGNVPGGNAPGNPPGGAPAPGDTPSGGNPPQSGATSPTGPPPGPAGTVYRPSPQLGAPQNISGLHVAPMVGNDPLRGFGPTQWTTWRCTQPTCTGYPVTA